MPTLESKILISLSCKYPPKYSLRKFLVFFILGVVPISIFTGLFFANFLPDRAWDWDFVWYFAMITIGLVSLSIAMFFVLSYIIYKRKFPRVLENVVVLTAYSKLKDIKELSGFYGSHSEHCRLEVSFDYNNETKTMLSKHMSLLNPYANREINILYSPKYNEVFILKDTF